jgi:hypothetical protein
MSRFNPTGNESVSKIWSAFWAAWVAWLIGYFVLGQISIEVPGHVVFGLFMLAGLGWAIMPILAREIRWLHEEGVAGEKERWQAVFDNKLCTLAQFVRQCAQRSKEYYAQGDHLSGSEHEKTGLRHHTAFCQLWFLAQESGLCLRGGEHPSMDAYLDPRRAEKTAA